MPRRPARAVAALLGEVTDGEHPQPALLGRRHGLGRQTEPVGRAGLDLTEHQVALSLEHQVDLALAAAPVARDHPVAPGEVPVGGELLAP